MQKLLLGNDSPLIQQGRVITTQAIGGTGALKTGADFLKRLLPDATVAISDPSWENHRALFEAAGFPVRNYRYYDAFSNGVNRGGLLEDLKNLPARSIVVLHACCHNPTGVDLTPKTGRRCWKSCANASMYPSSTSPTRVLATVLKKTPRRYVCSPNLA